MKTFLSVYQTPALGWTCLVLFSAFSLPIHAADKPAPPTPIEHKAYTLFMGADFQIERDRKLYPVIDVRGDSFVIEVNGERVLVPIDRGQLKLKANEALKITAKEVPVRELTIQRAYTPARDPRKKFMKDSPVMAEMQDTQWEGRRASGALQDYQATTKIPNVTALQVGAAWNNYMSAESGFTQAQTNAIGLQYGSGGAAGQMEDELAKELFDAVEIQFKVSSPKPLVRPYVIVVARYRNPDDRPNEARNWIFAKQLNPIGDDERDEHFLQGGLVPGFKMISTEFHLYNEGKEIATDVAHKRVPLSREEAYEYSVIEYIGAHKKQKDKTAPMPAMANFPSDFLDHLGQDEVQGTFFVKVGADGKAREVYKDEACKMKVDDSYLADGLKSIWFEPALEKGKPVDGIAKIRPNKLRFVFEVKT
jgi:hypothetical protein